MSSRRLSPGQAAPPFQVRDWQGNPVGLSYPLERKLLLCFFRYASCPLCNLRVQELIRQQQRLKDHGIDILAIFQSPPERIRHYVGRQQPPFPLIPDPDRKLYHIYGVESSWGGFLRAWTAGIGKVLRAVIGKRFLPGTVEGELHRIPADFLIDIDGRLSLVYYGRDIGDHLPLEHLFNHTDNACNERETASDPR
jgi:peroxiredoxin